MRLTKIISVILILSFQASYGKEKIAKETNNIIADMLPWRAAQKTAKDTVVQLFVQTSEFNWLEPFKSPKQEQAWGTGFFIDTQGHLVSNFHVIDEAASVKIQIPSFGKERFDVDVIGVSPDRDVTLLKLTPEARKTIVKKLGKIPFLKLGDSDKVVRTQEVLALGYPLGQEKLKSTQGIVSGRENMSGESYIQITAAINNGSSGGPSLNKHGDVIGINTASISRAQSVGYIIPINDVKNVITELHKAKFLHKPILGFSMNKGTPELTEYLKNPKPGGLYLSRVYKNTLLEKAGVKAGDMIYTINGNTFDRYGETNVPWSEDKVPIVALLNRFKLREKISITFYRNGEKKDVSFNFDLTKQLPIRTIYPEFEKVDYEIIGGMVIMELTLNHVSIFEDSIPYFVKYWKRKNRYEPKLVITHVFPNSQARQARVVYPGNVLTEVNQEKVLTLSDFRNAIKKTKKFASFKRENKKLMVLSLEKILEDEDDLSQKYVYKKSKLVIELEKKLSSKLHKKERE